MKNFIKKLNIVPSWLIFILDVMIVIVSSFFAIVLRDNFQFLSQTHFSFSHYFLIAAVISIIRILVFYLFRTNQIVVRYTNTKDIARIFWCTLTGTIFLFLFNLVSYFINGQFLIPTSIVIIEFFITTFAMVFYRLSFKLLFLEMINPAKLKRNIVIFGAGESGITTKRALDRDTSSKYNVLAFFDEDPNKIGKQLESIPVYDPSELSTYLFKNEISFLIISIQGLSAIKKSDITDISLQHRVKVLVVPPVNQWINGELSFKQIKKIKIEELLEREEIVTNHELINLNLRGKTILVTGAAGSIGSEITKQLLTTEYKQLILIDNAETPIFYLLNDNVILTQKDNIKVHIANICDDVMMKKLFSQYQPDLIYHAAAYKHVPLMEENVGAAIKTNIKGTKILADLAVDFNVQKFVMVSTDKAVNPTSVMGASKRIAEIYVQSLSLRQNNTKFITTRFGNVLDSNGSVIPIFRRQIENGGPITVTHRDITRYFMTISEACQLVINAGIMGNGGEIFVFDMGKSVKIYDLAKKMIQLSGLTLGKDITISVSGLRPGEKLYEELLSNEENTLKTEHDKILIAKANPYPYEQINAEIEQLIQLQNEIPETIVSKMKQIVPEFISENSVYETIN